MHPKINISHIDTNKNEKCIMCGCETDILVSTPINERVNYIEGCGQLCDNCFAEIKPSDTLFELSQDELRNIANMSRVQIKPKEQNE